MRWQVALVLSALSATAVSQETLPQVASVERQPLLSQVTRLGEALQAIGSPLDAESQAALERLKSASDDKAVASEVQKLLDPRCLFAVDLSGERPKVIASNEPVELFEQGWRAYLVKVINPHGATGRLDINSPNAAPVPRAPADAVESRWLSLESYEGQPLRPKLSGLPLEYRIVQLYSRDVGERQATLNVAVIESDDQKDAPRGSAELTFNAVASTPVTFEVTDNGQPATAAFEIRDPLGSRLPAAKQASRPRLLLSSAGLSRDG